MFALRAHSSRGAAILQIRFGAVGSSGSMAGDRGILGGSSGGSLTGGIAGSGGGIGLGSGNVGPATVLLRCAKSLKGHPTDAAIGRNHSLVPQAREWNNLQRYGFTQMLFAALLLVKSRSGVVRRIPAVACVHPETVGSTVMVTVLLVPGDICPSLQTINAPWVHPWVAETKVVCLGRARSANTLRASSS